MTKRYSKSENMAGLEQMRDVYVMRDIKIAAVVHYEELDIDVRIALTCITKK